MDYFPSAVFAENGIYLVDNDRGTFGEVGAELVFFKGGLRHVAAADAACTQGPDLVTHVGLNGSSALL